MFNILILLLISSNVFCQKFNSTSTGMKSAKNDVPTVTFTKCQGNYLDNVYINERFISNDQFTAVASSERDNYPFSNAFDQKRDSYWVGKDLNTETFKNFIIISFKETQKLEAILYVTPYSVEGSYRVYDGVPGTLTIYASIGNEEFKPVCVFTGEATWPDDIFQFVFPQVVECDKLKIEFTEITICRKFGFREYVPATGELTLIKKLSDEYLDIQKQINGLFSDYAQFQLIPSITSEKISELREKAAKLENYQSNIKPLLDRAEAVIKGTLRKDPHREFSTKPGSKNKIEQFGNNRQYCLNVVKFQKFGYNGQVIGIGGYGDKPITVFVDVEPNEGVQKSEVKLPSIKFTQKDGAYQHTFKSENLKLGRNDLIFHNFVKNHDSYNGIDLIAGGPIHIENPFTLEEQKGHVTIYIEQGYIYPVFRSGDDEEAFKVILKDYYERFNDPNDEEIIIDSFELISKHFVGSTTTKLAYDAYINRGVSIQDNLNRWDKYIRDLLEFAGLSFDPNDESYDIRNEYVRENYRGCQEWAGSFAFAAYEFVGLPYESSQSLLIDLKNPGWAMAHETGHALDKPERMWSENTNNMWSMHDMYRMSNDVQDKLSISQVNERLSSDFSEYVTHAGGKVFQGANPDVWWILEGACPGYWPKSENLYIYERSDFENGKTKLDKCERFIYYACLTLKKNLCAYFERFGFYFKNDPTFNAASNFWTYGKSTQNFKDLLQKAIDDGRVVDECPKYWYVNLEHYRVLNKHNNKLGDWATCYSNNDEIRAVSIKKFDTYYSLTLPEIKNRDAHLCYEVQSFIDNKWQVVGITYSQYFNDNYPYANDFTPKYRIIGYDRNFHTTKVIENDNNPVIETIEQVARIGDKYYNTLQAALDDVKTDDVIVYIMKSFSVTSLLFGQNKMKIEPDPSLTESVIISKTGPGYLINNKDEKCKRLEFGSTSGVRIIFDGNNIRNKGNFIYNKFNNVFFYNCIFRNNHNEDDGGAIYVSHDSRIHLTDSIIEGCSARNGGAVFTTGGYKGVYDGKIELVNSVIRNCVASVNGGAIYGSAVNGWNNIHVLQNSIIENNEAQNGGAISFICYCRIRNSIIRNNKAHVNGGALFFNKEKERDCLAEIDHSTFENNIAEQTGYTIYIREPNTVLHLNGGKIFGNFHKADGSLIYFQKHQDPQELPDFSATKFFLNIPKDGVNLIDNIANYNVDSIINQIKIENGYARKGDGTIKAIPNRCTLKVNFNGQIINYEINTGLFTFPNTFEGFSEDHYITEWRSGGKTYKIGDKLNILTGMDFDISTKTYFRLIFNYGSQIEQIKVTQGFKYYLPTKTPDGSRLLGFDCSNGKYYAYAEPVEVTSDLTFTAVLLKSYTIIVMDNEVMTVYSRKYGEHFILPEPTYTGGDKFFKYWIINGENYQPNNEIAITSDTTITAFYSDSITVKLIFSDREEIRNCKLNDEIDLYYSGPEKLSQAAETGRDFDYWLIDGKKYLLYSKYIVKKNVDIFAHYAVIDKTQKFEVNFEVPIVQSSSSTLSIKSTTNIKQSFSYLDNLTFPDGETFGDFGSNKDTSEDIRFIYWDFNGVRYNKNDIIGVTTSFNVVAVTGSENDLIPTQSPTPNVTPSKVPPATTIPPPATKIPSLATKIPPPATNIPPTLNRPITGPENPTETNKDPDQITGSSEGVNMPAEKDESNKNKKKGGSNAGMIAGIVIALVAVAAVAAVVTYFFIKKKKQGVANEESINELSNDKDNNEPKDPEKPENQENQPEQQPKQANEQKSEPVNEQKLEPLNEQKPEPVNKQPPEPVNEQKPEPVNEQPPEPVNEQPPETVNEQPPETVNEQPPETVNEQPPEPVNEQPPETMNEQPPEPVNEQPPEPVNEQPPETVNEQPPEPVNEQPPEPVNEQPPETVNEQPPETVNEQPPETVNEQPPE